VRRRREREGEVGRERRGEEPLVWGGAAAMELGEREPTSSREERVADLPNAWEGEDPGTLGHKKRTEGAPCVGEEEEACAWENIKRAARDKADGWKIREGESGWEIG
jgi:hypothetical protein